MMYSNCYTVSVEWYHQTMAEAARDRELVKLYELQNDMLKSQIERNEVALSLTEKQVKLAKLEVELKEKLLAAYRLEDEMDKLLSISFN